MITCPTGDSSKSCNLYCDTGADRYSCQYASFIADLTDNPYIWCKGMTGCHGMKISHLYGSSNGTLTAVADHEHHYVSAEYTFQYASYVVLCYVYLSFVSKLLAFLLTFGVFMFAFFICYFSC